MFFLLIKTLCLFFPYAFGKMNFVWRQLRLVFLVRQLRLAHFLFFNRTNLHHDHIKRKEAYHPMRSSKKCIGKFIILATISVIGIPLLLLLIIKGIPWYIEQLTLYHKWLLGYAPNAPNKTTYIILSILDIPLFCLFFIFLPKFFLTQKKKRSARAKNSSKSDQEITELEEMHNHENQY